MRREKEGRRSRAQVGASSVGLPPERDRGACKRFERREGAVAVPERLFKIPGGVSVREFAPVGRVQEGEQEILHDEQVEGPEGGCCPPLQVLLLAPMVMLLAVSGAVAGQG